MTTIYSFSHVDAKNGATVRSDRQYHSIAEAVVGAVKYFCLTMSEHDELQREQGLTLWGERVEHVGVSEISIVAVPANTWSARALVAVRARMAECRELQHSNYLTLEERTFWAAEAKRMFGLKQRVVRRSGLSVNVPRLNTDNAH